MKKESLDLAIKSLEIERDAIGDIINYLDVDAFSKAVDALANCNRIMTCASGSSGIATKKFAHSLCCIELNAMFMPPSEAVHGGLGGLKKGDVMVMVSRGGKTVELLPIIDVCNKKQATLIAVTENLQSPLAENADIVVPLKIEKESDKLGVMATSSFIAKVALFDAMLAALIEETSYTKEQFALIHPGGAVGQMLNHAEKPIFMDDIEKTIKRADEVGLATIVCADTVEDVIRIAKLNPNLIVAEPTELIGTGETSDMAYVKATIEAVDKVNPDIMVLQGAGISNGKDVYNVIKAGAMATGCTSGIIKANDPPAMVEEMIYSLRNAWDELYK